MIGSPPQISAGGNKPPHGAKAAAESLDADDWVVVKVKDPLHKKEDKGTFGDNDVDDTEKLCASLAKLFIRSADSCFVPYKRKMAPQTKETGDVSPPPKASAPVSAETKDKMELMTNSTETVAQSDISKAIAAYLRGKVKGQREAHPIFVGDKVPSISLEDYVERLIHLTNKWFEEPDGPDSFAVNTAILAVEYLSRADVAICELSVHRYFMAAQLVAIKVLHDTCISSGFWAEVGGCPRASVNFMSLHLCKTLEWRMSVTEEALNERRSAILNENRPVPPAAVEVAEV